MTSNGTSSGNVSFFLPSSTVFSQDPEQFLIQLTNLYIQISRAVNSREVSLYNTTQIADGELWYNLNNSAEFRKGYRNVYTYGAIAAGATGSATLNPTGAVQYTRIYGVATTSVPDFRPIPYSSVNNITDQIAVAVNSTVVNVINGATAAPITSAFVVLEYLYT